MSVDEFIKKERERMPSRFLDFVARGKWIPHVKGGPRKESFEISVVREDNKFGMESYGWFDLDMKRLICHNGGPCRDPIADDWLWEQLIGVARMYARHLNGIERRRRGGPPRV